MIAAPPGPVVVIAGAGAGKTETMAARVVWLVANGYANKEIAEKLALTLSTVCWYLHEIYKKLHVQSRVQAVNKLRQTSSRSTSS